MTTMPSGIIQSNYARIWVRDQASNHGDFGEIPKSMIVWHTASGSTERRFRDILKVKFIFGLQASLFGDGNILD